MVIEMFIVGFPTTNVLHFPHPSLGQGFCFFIIIVMKVFSAVSTH